METGERTYQNILSHFVKCTMKGNRLQNGIMVLAVVLVTLLMTVMFGAGIGTVQNIQMAELRMRGTTANGFLMKVSDREVIERIKELDYVSSPGVQQFVGIADGIMDIGMTETVVMNSYSETEWQSQIFPTITGMQGNVPIEENEIMLSEWTLEKLNVNQPKIGMTVTIPFTTLDGEQRKEDFVLTGWYHDYIKGNQTSGNIMAAKLYYMDQGLSKKPVGNIIVSERFADIYAKKEGRLITFHVDKNLNSEVALQKLSADLLTNEIMVAGLNNGYASAITIIILPALLIVLVIICGYLLVYNIMNISILRDMHMFGQLKTLGATSRQIKTIVRRQTNIFSFIGIPIGLVLGLFLSNIILPGLLETIMGTGVYGTYMTYDISVSPIICIFAVIFAYLTIFISCSRPARIAGKVSPIEALRYTEQSGNIRQHHTSNGGKIYRMAFRNVFRNRKRAIITLLSLFMGMFLFMALQIALYDIDLDLKFNNEIPNNFMLSNLSFQTENYEGLIPFFDEKTVKEIKDWDGVEQVICEYAEPALITGGQENLELYRKRQAELTEEAVTETFQVIVSGLPEERLLAFAYESTFSQEEVQTLMNSGQGIFLPALADVDYHKLTGTEIIIAHRKQPGMVQSYTIAGILKGTDSNAYNDRYDNFGNIRGNNDTVIYMSEAGIRRLAEEPVVLDFKLNGDSAKDEQIQNRLEMLFEDNAQIEINSQLESGTGVADSIKSIKNASMIFSLFLLFMGMINFVNVIFTSIYSRQKELATMESIGMTQGQIQKMLILEGVYYSGLTMVLLLTVGVLISFEVVQLVKNIIYFATFGVPIGMLTVIFLIMLALCAVIPLIAFRNIAKESIVERLRKGTD